MPKPSVLVLKKLFDSEDAQSEAARPCTTCGRRSWITVKTAIDNGVSTYRGGGPQGRHSCGDVR